MTKFERMKFRYCKKLYRQSRRRKTRHRYHMFVLPEACRRLCNEEDFNNNVGKHIGIFRNQPMGMSKSFDDDRRKRSKRRSRKK